MFRLTLALFLLHVTASLAQLDFIRAEKPVPPGLQVTLETDRQEYLLGENVLVHFVVTNAGQEPLAVESGGDYRGAPRHLRFHVTITDEQGAVAADPFPPPYYSFGGGLGGPMTLEPGEKWEQSVPIMSYATPDHAGRYVVRIAHDLGYSAQPATQPAAEMTLTFRMPEAEQAEKILPRYCRSLTCVTPQ